MITRSLFFLWLSVAIVSPVLADEPESPPETPLERSNRILKEIDASFAKKHHMPEPARLDGFPEPKVKPSPEEIAREFNKFNNSSIMPFQKNSYNLMVFVSFSMPLESLRRVVEQSEKTGAQIVFRGFAGDSMKEMSQKIADLIGSHRVEVSVNPPAFTQYKITAVPSLVLALSTADNELEEGCALPSQYVKVVGDVGQDYALDIIERKSPAFARAAQYFSRRLVRGIN